MKEVSSDIDFADSRYISCQMTDNYLVIHLNSWDNKIIEITFFNVVGFVYKTSCFTAGLFENTDSSSLLKECIKLTYETFPESHPYRSYVIKDIDDFDFFEVIAENVAVTKDKLS